MDLADFFLNTPLSLVNRRASSSMDSTAAQDLLYRYEIEVFSMQRPDKGIINALTMMAADNIENVPVANGIVRTIERCIQQMQPSRKIIPLYVMDSIIKNVGGIYTRMIMQNLAVIFSSAFLEVDNTMRASFIKLLDTWQTQAVFSRDVIDDIRVRLANILQVCNFERESVMCVTVVYVYVCVLPHAHWMLTAILNCPLHTPSA